MDNSDLERAVEAILFAAGEPVGAVRMAGAVGCEVEDIHAAAQRIMDRLSFARSGIRVLRLEERAFLGMAEEERASLLALYRKYLSLLRQESEQIFQQFQEE